MEVKKGCNLKRDERRSGKVLSSVLTPFIDTARNSAKLRKRHNYSLAAMLVSYSLQ